MATLLEVKDLATYFYTFEGVVKAVDGVSYEVEEENGRKSAVNIKQI